MAESVQIRGLPELFEKFDQLSQIVKQMSSPTAEALELLRERMEFYPPAPPDSTYERTEDLKNSWQQTMIISSLSIVARLFSNIPYGPLVQDDEFQAGIHRDCWQTTKSVAEEEEDNIYNLYEQQLARML